MAHGPGSVEHWQQWWSQCGGEEQHARQLAKDAEAAAGSERILMGDSHPFGRRTRPAYGSGSRPSLGGEAGLEEPAVGGNFFPEISSPTRSAGQPCRLLQAQYPDTLRCANPTCSAAVSSALIALSLLRRRYVRSEAYAPQWQRTTIPGTPSGRAGRGVSIDFAKSVDRTRFFDGSSGAPVPADTIPAGSAGSPAPDWAIGGPGPSGTETGRFFSRPAKACPHTSSLTTIRRGVCILQGVCSAVSSRRPARCMASGARI